MNLRSFEVEDLTKKKPLFKNEQRVMYLLEKMDMYWTMHPRMQIDDFQDIPKDEREADKADLEEQKGKFEYGYEEAKEEGINLEQMKNLSMLFEVSMFELMEANKFLGDKCKVIPTSEWDDIFTRVDGVLMLDEGLKNEYLGGFEFDVTFSSNPDTLQKKIKKIKRNIRRGELPTLKYFKDPKTKEHKKISLPEVIIGAERSSAEGLIELWGDTRRSNAEKLKNHPIQSKIIMELIVQLKAFYDFAKNLCDGTEDDDLKDKYWDIYVKYGHMYNYIYENVYLPNEKLIKSHINDINQDKVYKNILELTNNLK